MKENCCNPRTSKNKTKWFNFKIDYFLLSMIFVTVLILGLVVFLGIRSGGSSNVEANTSVVTEIDTLRHDWGEIDYDAGTVEKTFSIKNNGSSVMKIYNVKTSCMCTTAQLITKESRSKKFGMHEKGTDIFEIDPGETAQMLVEFEPDYHGPSGLGPITRVVSMNTNDKNNPTLEFYLTGEVSN